MLTYLIYPDWYWPRPFYYWPLILPPIYDVIEPCETEIWIIDEDLAPTGNEYYRPADTLPILGSDSDAPTVFIPAELLAPTGNVVAGPIDIPFIVHEELTATGNTYFREPDTPQIADSDSPTYFGIWKKKGHA